MQRISVTYAGRVQGVGFRATVRSLARPMPLSGWVRNEPDGTVRLEVQGDKSNIERLLVAVRREMGRGVTRETIDTIPILEGESGFNIAS